MNKSYSLELHISIQIFNLDSFPWKNTTGLLYTQPWKATQGCSTPSFSMSPMDPNKSSVIFLCIGNFPWMGIGKRCYEPPPIHELSFPAYWPPGISCVAEKKAANATVVYWYCTSVYICNFFLRFLRAGQSGHKGGREWHNNIFCSTTWRPPLCPLLCCSTAGRPPLCPLPLPKKTNDGRRLYLIIMRYGYVVVFFSRAEAKLQSKRSLCDTSGLMMRHT